MDSQELLKLVSKVADDIDSLQDIIFDSDIKNAVDETGTTAFTCVRHALINMWSLERILNFVCSSKRNS